METLRARPEDLTEAGTVNAILALDNDGVVNIFEMTDGPHRERIFHGTHQKLVRTGHGDKFWIDYDLETVQALDDVIRAHCIALGWSTTWGPNVRPLIEQAFGGLLAGGYVLEKMPAKYRGRRNEFWKRDALVNRVIPTGLPFIWADDDEVTIALTTGSFTDTLASPSTAPHLLLATDSTTGITLAEIASIDTFLTGLR
jgi:hypothetical protein